MPRYHQPLSRSPHIAPSHYSRPHPYYSSLSHQLSQFSSLSQKCPQLQKYLVRKWLRGEVVEAGAMMERIQTVLGKNGEGAEITGEDLKWILDAEENTESNLDGDDEEEDDWEMQSCRRATAADVTVPTRVSGYPVTTTAQNSSSTRVPSVYTVPTSCHSPHRLSTFITPQDEAQYPQDDSKYRYIYYFSIKDRSNRYCMTEDVELLNGEGYLSGFVGDGPLLVEPEPGWELSDDEDEDDQDDKAAKEESSNDAPQKTSPPPSISSLRFISHLPIKEAAMDFGLGGIWVISTNGFWYRLMNPLEEYKPFFLEYFVKASIFLEIRKNVSLRRKEGLSDYDITMDNTIFVDMDEDDKLDVYRFKEFMLHHMDIENFHYTAMYKQLKEWTPSKEQLAQLQKFDEHSDTLPLKSDGIAVPFDKSYTEVRKQRPTYRLDAPFSPSRFTITISEDDVNEGQEMAKSNIQKRDLNDEDKMDDK